ncbi:DUF2637 domain-containing protein [Streptomyces sp. WAC06614]|uniref:DUF2637 domain-containing protein n=1 Tax=Streptomyces sp. WAC06614 TaxID=2487416 RepID=UPI000F794483|nr:DUF2637 domain-containing protein [Streptomyces sp. WAC06614]RSS81043.1 DUF2637 domain-containing protein [Streptomyces sp. WAC06614]
MAAMQLTRTHRILIGVVVAGAVIIAGIGFAGSYAAVRALALKKGFGDFSLVFPIGIDAGICVLLALDLLLTWIRIPFPLLRQTAWLLTAATIAFNGAAAWPDPLGVGMHAVIPVLFVVTVEAARHAVGRIADITADRHMEGVRLTRWFLSPVPTFKLWRRMKLWELRSYEQAVGMEQDRLIYQARLQARYGRNWRRKAPVEALMPLRLARIGVPLAQTAPEGLAAAGIDPVLLPPAAMRVPALEPAGEPAAYAAQAGPGLPAGPGQAPHPQGGPHPQAVPPQGPHPQAVPALVPQGGGVPQQPGGRVAQPAFAVDPTAMPGPHPSAWFAAHADPQTTKEAREAAFDPQYVEGLEPTPVLPPTGPDDQAMAAEAQQLPLPGTGEQQPGGPQPVAGAEGLAQDGVAGEGEDFPDEIKFAEAAYEVFRMHVDQHGGYPSAEQIDILLADAYGMTHPRSASLLRRLMPQLKQRYQTELENEHIA